MSRSRQQAAAAAAASNAKPLPITTEHAILGVYKSLLVPPQPLSPTERQAMEDAGWGVDEQQKMALRAAVAASTKFVRDSRSKLRALVKARVQKPLIDAPRHDWVPT
jgi:hypothetical protein